MEIIRLPQVMLDSGEYRIINNNDFKLSKLSPRANNLILRILEALRRNFFNTLKVVIKFDEIKDYCFLDGIMRVHFLEQTLRELKCLETSFLYPQREAQLVDNTAAFVMDYAIHYSVKDYKLGSKMDNITEISHIDIMLSSNAKHLLQTNLLGIELFRSQYDAKVATSNNKGNVIQSKESYEGFVDDAEILEFIEKVRKNEKGDGRVFDISEFIETSSQAEKASVSKKVRLASPMQDGIKWFVYASFQDFSKMWIEVTKDFISKAKMVKQEKIKK